MWRYQGLGDRPWIYQAIIWSLPLGCLIPLLVKQEFTYEIGIWAHPTTGHWITYTLLVPLGIIIFPSFDSSPALSSMIVLSASRFVWLFVSWAKDEIGCSEKWLGKNKWSQALKISILTPKKTKIIKPRFWSKNSGTKRDPGEGVWEILEHSFCPVPLWMHKNHSKSQAGVPEEEEIPPTSWM